MNIKAGKIFFIDRQSKGNDCSDCFSSPRDLPISRLMIYQSFKRFVFCYPQHYTTRTFDFIISTLFLLFPTLFLNFILNLFLGKKNSQEPWTSAQRKQIQMMHICHFVCNFSGFRYYVSSFFLNFRPLTFVTGWFSHRLLTHHL